MLETLKSIVNGSMAIKPDHIVAMSAEGTLKWAELTARINFWQSRVQTISGPHILIYQPRGDELLACLLAVWRENKVAVLSCNNNLPGIDLNDGQKDWLTQGLLTGIETGLPVAADSALVLFTSGSSGEPAAVSKTFKQLDAEVGILESIWGLVIANSIFVSTVSRHHMYGLPFALLWPVLRGSVFYSETVHYAQTLESLARRFALTIVTSPVQLDNLPDNLHWPTIKEKLACMFSAGAPLSEAAARFSREHLIPVTEIYGSTESGAIAWREQSQTHLWQCLPGIQIKLGKSNQLQLRSPCLEDPDNWFDMADRVRLHSSNIFDLFGRIDRIIKVGGKRISLTGVEKCISSHPWVKNVGTLLLDGRKSRLGAVVVLNPEGRAVLTDRGKQTVNRVLAKHIGGQVERVAVPRYWRYLSRMPVDTQGKTSTELLKTLFFSEQQPRLPDVLERHRLSESCKVCLVLRIPDNLYYFTGHFPGTPVLPGVVQINWVQYYVRQYFEEMGDFLRIENLKFQNIIQPGDIVTLELNWDTARSRLLFRYLSGDKTHASGRLFFSPELGRSNA